MKVALLSDVHLEFGFYHLTNDDCADVLVLAGDVLVSSHLKPYDEILEGTKSQEYHKFFELASSQYKDVIFVMGNHEHYNGDFAQTETNLRKCLKRYPNVHLLENQTITIGDVIFVGGTMWTDMNKEDPQTMFHAKSVMNDFKVVQNSNATIYRTVPIYKDGVQAGSKRLQESAIFSPRDSIDEFNKFTGYLQCVLENQPTEKIFVVSHHAPCHMSVAAYYKHDYLMNGCFFADQSDLIMDNPQIKCWAHGHMHIGVDYMLGDTRVVCNPRGYAGYESTANTAKPMIIEV